MPKSPINKCQLLLLNLLQHKASRHVLLVESPLPLQLRLGDYYEAIEVCSHKGIVDILPMRSPTLLLVHSTVQNALNHVIKHPLVLVQTVIATWPECAIYKNENREGSLFHYIWKYDIEPFNIPTPVRYWPKLIVSP